MTPITDDIAIEISCEKKQVLTTALKQKICDSIIAAFLQPLGYKVTANFTSLAGKEKLRVEISKNFLAHAQAVMFAVLDARELEPHATFGPFKIEFI